MAGVIDCRGLSCPEPVLQARQAMTGAEKGEVTVLVDTAVARDNVVRAAKSLGWRADIKDDGDVFKLFLQK